MRTFVRVIFVAIIVGDLLALGFFAYPFFVGNLEEESPTPVDVATVDVVAVQSLAQDTGGAPYLVQVQEDGKDRIYLAERISEVALGKKLYGDAGESITIASLYSSQVSGRNRIADSAILEIVAGDARDVVVLDIQAGTSYSLRETWEGNRLLGLGSELGLLLSFERWDLSDRDSFWVYSAHFVDKEPQYLVKVSVVDGSIQEKLPVYRGFPYQPYSE